MWSLLSNVRWLDLVGQKIIKITLLLAFGYLIQRVINLVIKKARFGYRQTGATVSLKQKKRLRTLPKSRCPVRFDEGTAVRLPFTHREAYLGSISQWVLCLSR